MANYDEMEAFVRRLNDHQLDLLVDVARRYSRSDNKDRYRWCGRLLGGRMNINIRKLITKQFFNTLSPDVCHHLMALAKERIEETEWEYVKAISSRKWNDNKAKLGCLLVSQLMEGNDIGCDVFTTTKTELLFTDMPLTEVLKGGEAIVEYAEDYGDFEERRKLPCRENNEFIVAFRDNSMADKVLSSRLNGCYIHPNVKISDMGTR